MKKAIQLTFTLFLALLLQNCQDDEFNNEIITNPPTSIDLNDQIFQSENFGNTTTGNFIGFITNKNGEKLENVQVTIGNMMTMTDRNGIFILNNAEVYENFAYIKTTKDGYIDGSRVVIPKTDGTNKINIVMLKKEVTATINSGQNAQVSLANGALVNFSGGFIKADGNPYNGQVEVVAHYVSPNSNTRFTEMPGSLFAQDASNNAQSLETYGMISVNLFSPSGEQLNIDENNPSTITFPIEGSQASMAPETIDLWYFDEEVGYWKEEGQATKEGNTYVAEVTHFTWWNCDIPFDSIQFCFTATATNANINSSYHVIILNPTTYQRFFSGYITSTEIECGLIPRNEEILIYISNIAEEGCISQVVYSETLGGYSTDTSIDISFTETFHTSTLTGTVTNCEGNTITNGYIYINDKNTFNVTNGNFALGVTHCTLNSEVDIQVFDYDTNFWGIIENVVLDGTTNNLGVIATCSDSGGIFNGNLFLGSQQDVDNFGQSGYTVINGDLNIGNQANATNITNLSPLTHITSVTNNLNIIHNENLENLVGLENITSIGDEIRIQNNPSLSSLIGFPNDTSLDKILNISYNDALVTLQGLEVIEQLNFLTIDNNNELSSLTGLNNLTQVLGLIINDNDQLTTLTGLENLAELRSLEIYSNNGLLNLNGLENLTTMTPSIFTEIAIGVRQLGEGACIGFADAPNPNLSDFCALFNVMNSSNWWDNTHNNPCAIILNNAYNPSPQDIIDGNCSQ